MGHQREWMKLNEKELLMDLKIVIIVANIKIL